MGQFLHIPGFKRIQFEPSCAITQDECNSLYQRRSNYPNHTFYMRGDGYFNGDIRMVFGKKSGIQSSGFKIGKENDNEIPTKAEADEHTHLGHAKRLISFTLSPAIAYGFSCSVRGQTCLTPGYVYFVKSTQNKTLFDPKNIRRHTKPDGTNGQSYHTYKEAEFYATSFVPFENVIAFCRYSGSLNVNINYENPDFRQKTIDTIFIRQDLPDIMKMNIFSCMVYGKYFECLNESERIEITKNIQFVHNRVVQEDWLLERIKTAHINQKNIALLSSRPAQFIKEIIELHCERKTWIQYPHRPSIKVKNGHHDITNIKVPKGIAKIYALCDKRGKSELNKIYDIAKSSLKTSWYNYSKDRQMTVKIYKLIMKRCNQLLKNTKIDYNDPGLHI